MSIPDEDALSDWRTTEAMIVYGGSFVQALGRLFRLADAVNARRLAEAFPDYMKKYREMGQHLKDVR